MKKLIVLQLLLFHVLCHAQDTTKVLFIGNSFTSQNNLPNLFYQLAQASGKNVVVASHMPGGISVGDTAQGTSAHMNNPIVYSLIKSNSWDYLVLQDNQGRFCLGYGQFPSSSLVIEGHIKIRDSLLHYHPCAHMIWYAGFGPKNGYPPYGDTGEALIDSIYRNYQYLLDTAGQVLAPIGPAFKRIIHAYPSMNLWSSDDVHPSLFGSYVIANILYTTIFKSHPGHSSYNPGITVGDDSLLKSIGYQTTIDSLPFSGLAALTPMVTQTGNTLSVTGYQNCSWFYNGVPYASNNCSVNINQTGNYYVIATDQNQCEFLSLEQTYSVLTETDHVVGTSDFQIYPNPVDNVLFYRSGNPDIQAVELLIYDAIGSLVTSIHIEQNQHAIPVGDLHEGLYILVIKSNDISENLKLIIRR